MTQDILKRARDAAAVQTLFLLHTLSQMNAPERMVSTHKVQAVLSHGVLVEDYPEDARGHSCLVLGWGDEGSPIHVVCAPKSDYLV